MPLRINVDRERLAEFCSKHRIRKLAFFGSVLRDDFRPDSDVDVLVEFEEGHAPGWELIDIEDELATLVERKVELGTPNSLIPRLRARVLSEAEVVYDAAG